MPNRQIADVFYELLNQYDTLKVEFWSPLDYGAFILCARIIDHDSSWPTFRRFNPNAPRTPGGGLWAPVTPRGGPMTPRARGRRDEERQHQAALATPTGTTGRDDPEPEDGNIKVPGRRIRCKLLSA